MTTENKLTIAGWASAFAAVALFGLLWYFEPQPPLPDPHKFARETVIVNTVRVVDVYKEGDFTRVQYRGRPSDKDLFVEPPSHFLGPCRIIHATRLIP